MFGSPTVVDNYRPGYEPNVAVDRSPGDSKLLYTSTPFGFSTTMSFIERSDDTGQSWHQIAAQVAGKPLTCVGGGDTEAQVDQVNGSLYFADLQGLTNYSASRSDNHGQSFSTSCASVNGTAVDRQWIGVDNNGGTSAVSAAATGGRLYFDYDNVEQSTDTSTVGSNQLVLNESVDGVDYGSNCLVSGVPCPGLPVVISPDEGLPGNLIVDNTPGGRYEHSVYAVHSNGGQTSNLLSYCRGADTGVPASAAAAAAYCTDPTALPANTSRVSTHWHDVNIDIPDAKQVDKAFDVIAIDTAGNLYATWAEAPIGTDAAGDTGVQTAPAQVYLSTSTDGGLHWSPKVQVNAPAEKTNIFPWISTGDPGKIDIAWYGSTDSTGAAPYDSDALNSGYWDVYLAQSMNALSAAPSFTQTKVSDHHVKYGNISTGGLGGSGDRSLGDFMQVQTGLNGEAILSYVDDTSGNRNEDFSMGTGETPAEAAGPTMIARQIGGPSLYGSTGNLGAAKAAVDSVSASTGNAFYAMAGVQTNAPAADDLTGVGVSRPDADHLQITMTTDDNNLAKDLSVSPTIGGPVGVWMVRWADRYETKLTDGLIRYVGMQSVAGGAPTFYTGATGCIATTRCKFFSYPDTTAVPGAISGNRITWTVPLSAIGGARNGDTLYSVTGTSVSQLEPTMQSIVTLPNAGDVANTQLPNTLDEAPSFSYTLRAADVGEPVKIPGQPVIVAKKTAGKKAAAGKKATSVKKPSSASGTLAYTGLAAGVPVLALVLAGSGLLAVRRRRRSPHGE